MNRVIIDNDEITMVRFHSRALGDDAITQHTYREGGKTYVDVPMIGETMTVYLYNGARCVDCRELEVEYKWRGR